MELQDAFEAGFNLFKQQPDLMLAEVWRMLPMNTNSAAEDKTSWAVREAFVIAYMTARKQHDEYKREQN